MTDEMTVDEMYENQEDKSNVQKEDTKKFLSFISDNLIFGVSAEHVIEIITNHTITKLPMVPDFVKGIINLRGQIIPIIDIRLRMHKPAIDYTSTSCIIVLDVNNIQVGILVDTVSQVVDICENNISPMPSNSNQELVNGMISLSPDLVMLMLDCELLINN